MVSAGCPVDSVILLAARPVGAQSLISIPFFIKYLIIASIIVVLPVPGPPVITATPAVMAVFTASL